MIFKVFICITVSLLIKTAGFAETNRSSKTQTEDEWVKEKLNRLSLNEKIGQLFMIAVYSDKNADYEENIESIIKKYDIGGLIFFQGTPEKQLNLITRYQNFSNIPLVIGMDAEHGLGWRLNGAMEFPLMLTAGAVADDSLIFRMGAAIARHCKEVGVHVNFAPVADINNNPANPVIGMRSFGENRDNVLNKTRMYIAGSLSEGVMPVVKHFPGHGDTEVDSHKSLPIIKHSSAYLDSIELYPFKQLIKEDVPAIMIAHLNVPALDSSNRPASLSPTIINHLLREELGFQNLCFTDAMNMQGVTKIVPSGQAEVQALLAGNDVLLFPKDVETAVKAIRKAIGEKVITEEMIDEKCRKILAAKYKFVLPTLKEPLKTNKLQSQLYPPKDIALKDEIYKDAITLIKNSSQLIPLKRLDTLRIASVNLGEDKINTFQTTLSNYAQVQHFTLSKNAVKEDLENLLHSMENYNCIIIYNNYANNRASSKFGYSYVFDDFLNKLKNKSAILCHPSIPYGLSYYQHLPNSVLISYENNTSTEQYAAQAIFGGIAIKGKLPVSINNDYPTNYGIITEKCRLGYVMPEMLGLSSIAFKSIDSVCQTAINMHATPGCQVLIAKDNYVIYNKAFGHHTYISSQKNRIDDIYDLASVTKVAATLPAIMKLYDEHKIALDSLLSSYYPPLSGSNKGTITVREVLAHQAGLKAFIPSFSQFWDMDKVSGKPFSTKPTTNNTMKLRDKLYANPNIPFKDSTFSFVELADYTELSPGVYCNPQIIDSLVKSIISSEINPQKNYLYSDLGFILLQKAVENITGESLDNYCKENFYNRLGAYSTDFLAASRLDMSRVVPTSFDSLYRKQEIHGYVHDPIAYILCGVAGHAGLFSDADDLAKIMSMYLNNGEYGGERYLSAEAIDLFGCQNNGFKNNHRGLGFDKPVSGNVIPGSSFGHLGFTGTMAWIDPDNNLIYIFLSNRTYPNEFNRKLSEENIRTNIQLIVYDILTNTTQK
ncbi:MAG: serine hydrolase [Culturomica sp.]|jgi:beta-glucosidase-like glycosyl hydrolase/CubicO group peptidase (beta-lactamase class C family)|nr:serine hydrolase [Culturomica sp.]